MLGVPSMGGGVGRGEEGGGEGVGLLLYTWGGGVGSWIWMCLGWWGWLGGGGCWWPGDPQVGYSLSGPGRGRILEVPSMRGGAGVGGYGVGARSDPFLYRWGEGAGKRVEV